MTFQATYRTPGAFSDMLMFSDGEVLTGLCFEGSPDLAKHQLGGAVRDLPVFRETRRWLDLYFSGKDPGFVPPYRLVGATPFREEVSREMLRIPFGATTTYGAIAARLAKRHGAPKMSARAVGAAVGWNPICLVVPCHRVLGSDGNITGYGGGIENKVALLRHEGHDPARFALPRHGRHWLAPRAAEETFRA